MQDPTREEIDAAIASWHNVSEIDPFDIEEAIYWFASEWHGGQSSNLYSILSTSDYRPGAAMRGVDPDSQAGWLKEFLEVSFE